MHEGCTRPGAQGETQPLVPGRVNPVPLFLPAAQPSTTLGRLGWAASAQLHPSEGKVQGKGRAPGGWQPWSGMSCLATVGSIRGCEGQAVLAGVGARDWEGSMGTSRSGGCGHQWAL